MTVDELKKKYQNTIISYDDIKHCFLQDINWLFEEHDRLRTKYNKVKDELKEIKGKLPE